MSSELPTLAGLVVTLLFGTAAPAQIPPEARMSPRAGHYRAWLDVPGGPLPFLLAIETEPVLKAWIGNGDERIPVPEVSVRGATLRLGMSHYDSRIDATVTDGGRRLEGTWEKRRGADEVVRLPFTAVFGEDRRFLPDAELGSPTADLSGRWSVTFESDPDEPAVALLEVGVGGLAQGTFLTTTGDYRFLAGRQDGHRLRLSCFDGAHAFLFDAMLGEDGALDGHFWAGAHWHETWRARRDPDASIGDAFAATTWTGSDSWGAASFPDLEGHPRRLDSPAFAGKARILHVFGSWCPNCHDASLEMVRLHETYGPRGLSVLGLAFELTGDAKRDAGQVRRYADRHGVTYPLLVAGLADKAAATEQLGLLDRVRSYPTTIFLHADGRVRAVHTGFTGPATGAAYQRQRRSYDALVEELLAEESE